MFEVVVWLSRRAGIACLVLGALAVQSCGGAALKPAAGDSPAAQPPGAQQPADAAGLDGALPGPPEDPAQSAAQIAAKRAQVNVLWDKQGPDTYTRQQGCVADTEAGTLSLLPEAGGYTCAVYQFQYLLATDRPLSLSIVLSRIPQRYYVGLSSYSMRRWDWHVVDVPTGNDYIPIPMTEQCINAGGALYVAIAGYDRDWFTVSQLRLMTDMQAPPPVGLTASYGDYGDHINLNWVRNNDAYPGLVCDAVVVERSLNPAGPYMAIAEVSAQFTEQYHDIYNQAEPLHTYPHNCNVFYRLRNRVGVVVGPPGSIAAGSRLLHTIGDLVASNGSYSDRVRLNWSDIQGAGFYEVQCRNIKSGPVEWTAIDSCTASTYDHTAANAEVPCAYNTVYEYRVRAALDSDVAPEWSNTDSGLSVLQEVTGLMCSKGTYLDSIRISWNPVQGAQGYNLYYRAKWPRGGAFTLLTYVSGHDTLEFWHSPTAPPSKPADANRTYEYRATAVLNADESKIPSNTDEGFYGAGAWPQFRHDSRHTGLSPLIAAQDNDAAWNPPQGMTGGTNTADPVTGPDQTVYVGSSDGNLYAFNPDGSVKWQFHTGGALYGSPAVDSERRLYLSCYYNSESQLVALDTNGTMLWRYPLGGSLYEGRGITSPVLGLDGRIAVGCMDYNVYMLYSNGLIGWSYNTGAAVTSPPAMADDGTVYVMSSDGVLHALTAYGEWLWDYDTLAPSRCSPTVDNAGVVIVGNDDGKLLALNPGGTLAWSCDAGIGDLLAGPALGPGGECYATGSSGRICALDAAHVLDWSFLLSSEEVDAVSQPAVGADGLIYTGGFFRMTVLFPDGTLNFEAPMSGAWQPSSPALGQDWCLIGDINGQLCAFGAMP